MKRLLWLTLSLSGAFPPHAGAQLAPPNEAGVTMGHVHLNVLDVEAQKKFWVGQVGARPVRMGAIEALELPGMLIFLRRQNPTGPVAGSVINHLGLKVRKLDDLMARFQAAGTPVEKPVIGRENTLQTYVTGPDGFRMELVEDPSLKTPVASHHLHYFLAEPALVKEWYTRYLLVKPGMRGPYEAGDVPGMNLTFAPLRTGRGGPTVGTKGRVLDHIGFEVTHLNEFRRRLEQSGIKFDQPEQQNREQGMAAAFFTDPWGAYIELTEGLSRLR